MSTAANQQTRRGHQAAWGDKFADEAKRAELEVLKRIEQETGRALYNHAEELVSMAYDALDGSEDLMLHHERHGTPSLQILTQYSQYVAAETVKEIADEIAGRRVIEIGAGVGFLALEMAKVARSVFAIEVDPAWSWVFTHSLYRLKPANLTWIFGSAETVADWLNGDVVVIATRSGVDEMLALGYRIAPRVVMLGLDGRR